MKNLLNLLLLALVLSGCVYPMPGDRGFFGHESEDRINAQIKAMNARGWNPNREIAGDWFDGPKASKILPTIYVTKLPDGCIAENAGGACSELNMVADTCQPYVVRSLDRDRMTCLERHEIKGHCSGKHHAKNSVASSSCGPM